MSVDELGLALEAAAPFRIEPVGAQERAVLTDSAGKPLVPPELSVRVLELDDDDLAAISAAAWRGGRVLQRDGLVLHSLGCAARIALPAGLGAPGAAERATALLRAVAAPHRVAPSAVVALAAFPFHPAAAGELVIPALSLLKRDGEDPQVVAIGSQFEASAPEARLSAARAPERQAPELPERFELISARSHAQFCREVERALRAIEAGRFDKVVLARSVLVRANRPFPQADLLQRLRALHPSCCTFAIDGFLGASPELLCRRRGASVESEPLAGTIARSGDPQADARLAAALLSSDKDRREHGVVVDAICAALAPFTTAVERPERPAVLELRNVAHLATLLRARLRDGAARASALELCAAIHPTPAVCGAPRAPALSYLEAHEGLVRNRYAGPVGYLDGAGDGEFWLGIRSAEVCGGHARLCAGVGIVEGSDPRAELAETQLKLQALLAVAVRP